MQHALSELPLALFTTLSSIGAGAYVALALAYFTATFKEEVAKKIDKLTIIPLVVVGIGFIASIFHLTTPLHGVYVFSNLGSSPLTNEIFVGLIFFVMAVIYWILGMIGKLSVSSRKVVSTITAVLGLAFIISIGFAYYLDTVISWHTPWTIVQMLGYGLAGGSILGIMTIDFAGGLSDLRESSQAQVAQLALSGIGTILAFAGVIGFLSAASSMQNALVLGSELIDTAVTTAAILSLIGFVLVFGCVYLLVYKSGSNAIAVVGTILVMLSVFVARLVFYALQISVGLAI